MTNKEAIELLKRATMFEPTLQNRDYPEAFDLAIRALEEHPTTCPNCDSGYAEGYSDGYLQGKEERPTGEWKLDDTEQFCYCSNCEDTFYPRPLDPSWDYCPHCGAKMKGAEE